MTLLVNSRGLELDTEAKDSVLKLVVASIEDLRRQKDKATRSIVINPFDYNELLRNHLPHEIPPVRFLVDETIPRLMVQALEVLDDIAEHWEVKRA